MLTPVRVRSPRRAVLAACAALITVPVAAGCGESGSSGTGADPATLAPSTAPLYGEAVVRPEGEQRDQLEALLKKVMRTDDPFQKIEDAFDKSASGDKVTYEKDIKPWLGQRVGAFLSGVSQSGSPDGAAIVATNDPDKALTAFKKGEKVTGKRSYKGVDYELIESGAVIAKVDDFAIIGTEGGVKKVVDVSKDSGSALSENDDFDKAKGEAGEDGLGFAYVDPQRLVDVAASSGAVDRSALTGFRQVINQIGRTIGISFGAEDKGFALTIAGIGAQKPKGSTGDAAGAVAAAPDDAWAAIGLGNVGEQAAKGVDQLNQIAGLTGVDIEEQLKKQSGIDLRDDLLSWMGDAVIWVRGQSVGDIGGALVVESKDEAKSRAAIAKIQRFANSQNIPTKPLSGVQGVDAGFVVDTGSIPVAVAAAGDKFVIAAGQSALEAALKPSGKLSDSATYKSAVDSLGDGIKPSVYIDVARALQLVEGVGAADDPSYRQAQPYLRAFSTIVAGGKHEGDVGRARLVIGVR